MKRGILLVNIGSPEAPTTAAVRTYLGRFLTDPRILGMPTWVRVPLVYGLIAPLRAPKSAAAYRKIWTPEGSPLTVYGEALAAAVGGVYGTLCGRPTLDEALDRLGDVGEIVVVPLFPQYAAATTASTMDALGAALSRRQRVPSVHVLPPFWANPGYLDAVAAVTRPLIDEVQPDRVLFSYHGLPLAHVRAACDRGPTPSGDCCVGQAPPPFCYRAQCLETTVRLAARLGIDAPVSSFQSRLGPAEWMGPSTVDTLVRLAGEGVRRVVVVTPSFVADCLETLEEIAMAGAETFREAGGEVLRVAPCVNVSPAWIEVVRELVGATPQAR